MCCLLLGHGQLAIGKKSRAEEESVGVSMYVSSKSLHTYIMKCCKKQHILEECFLLHLLADPFTSSFQVLRSPPGLSTGDWTGYGVLLHVLLSSLEFVALEHIRVVTPFVPPATWNSATASFNPSRCPNTH